MMYAITKQYLKSCIEYKHTICNVKIKKRKKNHSYASCFVSFICTIKLFIIKYINCPYLIQTYLTCKTITFFFCMNKEEEKILIFQPNIFFFLSRPQIMPLITIL